MTCKVCQQATDISVYDTDPPTLQHLSLRAAMAVIVDDAPQWPQEDLDEPQTHTGFITAQAA
ncbi:hypothetical protein [Saccharopolyspora erythraea]|uniref:hypothetical protein n=1 Tax=Saccharopolyspora erythraea TaxID=1836 RepID=UPI0001D310AD|nr:hypothetical protein [Saccharopolyspora erythraea]EQD87826.1 hypothetical protein N599_02520 [Saccharopolyspora erythraea D]QRK88824.1 hypothetical protein JQX30_30105 [Saccharopolyspora erythraea]